MCWALHFVSGATALAAALALGGSLTPGPAAAHYRDFVREFQRRSLHGDWFDVTTGVSSLDDVDPISGAVLAAPQASARLRANHAKSKSHAAAAATTTATATNGDAASEPYYQGGADNSTALPTVAPTPYDNQTDPDFFPDVTPEDQQRAWDAQLNRPGRADSYVPINIPVAFHIIYKTDGTGMVNINAVQRQVQELNQAFGAVEAKKAGWPTVSAAITFSLYSVDFTLNDDWYDNCALFNYQPTVKKALAVNPAKYYNVYSCHCTGNLGLSYIPYQAVAIYGSSAGPQVLSEDNYMLGSIIDSGLFPGSTYFNGRWKDGKILVHETGHHLGLMHIYQGGCVGTEQQSDQIYDTMRQNGNPSGTCPQLNGMGRTCPGIPCGDCVETKYDDNANYMGIAADSCRTHFTKGQVDYIRNTLTQYKPTFLKNLPVDCVAAVDSTDASPDLAPCRGPVQAAGTQGRSRAWCVTSPFGDSTQWGWACCASDGTSCRNINSFSLTVSDGRAGQPTAPVSAPPPTSPPTAPPTKPPSPTTPPPTKKAKNPTPQPTKCTYTLQGSSTPCAIPFTVVAPSGAPVTYSQPIPVFVAPPYNWATRKGVAMSTLWCPSVSSYSARSASSKMKWGPSVCS